MKKEKTICVRCGSDEVVVEDEATLCLTCGLETQGKI